MKFTIVFLSFCILFGGCLSTKPITQTIISDIGGVEEIEKLQYYVSKKLVLNDARMIRDRQRISEYGSAAIVDTVYKNRIIISKYTMGVGLKNYVDEKGNLILEICFEEDDNKRIVFKQDGQGGDRKFYLVYQDSFAMTIDYGGEKYNVSYSGDLPYLRVKINKRLKEKINTRRASGRRVQND